MKRFVESCIHAQPLQGKHERNDGANDTADTVGIPLESVS